MIFEKLTPALPPGFNLLHPVEKNGKDSSVPLLLLLNISSFLRINKRDCMVLCNDGTEATGKGIPDCEDSISRQEKWNLKY